MTYSRAQYLAHSSSESCPTAVKQVPEVHQVLCMQVVFSYTGFV